MDIPVKGAGLWERYIPTDYEAKARRNRCERDTMLDMSSQEHKAEGHRPCECPDVYRALTPDEKERLRYRLASSNH